MDLVNTLILRGANPKDGLNQTFDFEALNPWVWFAKEGGSGSGGGGGRGGDLFCFIIEWDPLQNGYLDQGSYSKLSIQTVSKSKWI